MKWWTSIKQFVLRRPPKTDTSTREAQSAVSGAATEIPRGYLIDVPGHYEFDPMYGLEPVPDPRREKAEELLKKLKDTGNA